MFYFHVVLAIYTRGHPVDLSVQGLALWPIDSSQDLSKTHKAYPPMRILSTMATFFTGTLFTLWPE